MAWLAVDNECALHYEVTLTGIPSHHLPLQLYLEDIPIEAYGAPVSRRLLEEFNGNYLEGFVLSIPSADLAKLETSVCFLEIVSKEKEEKIMRTRLKQIKVPNHCYPIYTDNDVPNLSYTTIEHNDNNLPSAETKCYHSGRFFDEGEQWHSKSENCTLCSCNHGKVKCDSIKCPPLKCKKDEVVHRKGDCCPSCLGKFFIFSHFFISNTNLLFFQEKPTSNWTTKQHPQEVATWAINSTKQVPLGIHTFLQTALIHAPSAPATY